MTLDEQLAAELDLFAERGRLRRPITLDGADRARPAADGAPLVSFASNDYLGLASHPAVIQAAQQAIIRFGVGAGAARLLGGDSPLHVRLEHALANLVQLPAALLFSTGYHANIGALSALAGPDDLIVSDAMNHASIIDGCRLSRARVLVYAHADAAAAATALATSGSFRRRILVTESLFSMDGDRAPLRQLRAAADRNDAVLLVDEAHALGTVGPSGGGLCRSEAVRPDVLVGTLGKAFGSAGGFVAGSGQLRSYLINRARTFIFTTATPPTVAAAALAGLEVAAGPLGADLRARAHANAQTLRQLLAADGRMPPLAQDLIIPYVLGTESAALEAAARLRTDGLLAFAVRPPTVPDGTCRLRLTVSAAHTMADVERLVAALRTLPVPS